MGGGRDGFVAAFASPMSAVNAAIDAQRELQLPVRMGLATGEAEHHPKRLLGDAEDDDEDP